MSYATELAYRKSAIEGASPIGLVIVLYDTLWGDFRRAAAAIRDNDIDLRCRELNHALVVLGQLESWVAPASGTELASSLTLFYRYLRAQVMEASVKQSPAVLEAAMELILHVRAAWQQRDAEVSLPVAESGSTFVEEANRLAMSFTA
jgi:flagellar protein FliS